MYNKSFLRDYEEFEAENRRGVGFLVELNGSQLILWSMKYKYNICEMNHEVFFKISENIVHFKYFSWFFAMFDQSSIRSETGNVVYIDAIPKSTQNSRVQWSVQLLSNFGCRTPNHLGEMFFSQTSTISSYYLLLHRTEKSTVCLTHYVSTRAKRSHRFRSFRVQVLCFFSKEELWGKTTLSQKRQEN